VSVSVDRDSAFLDALAMAWDEAMELLDAAIA